MIKVRLLRFILSQSMTINHDFHVEMIIYGGWFSDISYFRKLMKGKIAIVTMNPYFSIENPNSAVSIYLKTLGESLRKRGADVVYFPDNKFFNDKSIVPIKNNLKSNLKDFLKRNFPSIYFKKRFTNYFKDVDALNHHKDEFGDFELIIEFSSYGGKFGSEFKKNAKGKVAIIYDAPLDIQFDEMYGDAAKFRNLIENSEKSFVEDADLIFCYSESVKKYLDNKYKIGKPIVVLPCIVWKNDILPLNKSGNVIGFIGSFLKWHQPLLLVKAFERIADEFPSAELCMIGFGEEWKKVEDYRKQSVFRDRIRLPGFVSEEELSILKSTFTIGVMPGSNWYGSPLKLFEYAESGIPVIAPDTPTVTEYFRNRENALIIDKNNQLESLIEHLLFLMKNEEQRNRLSEAGYKLMQSDLSKEKVMTKFAENIEMLLR